MPAAGPELRIHGTAIALAGRAAVLRGPSGAGKSDLALRCLRLPPGDHFDLVADDQVMLTPTPQGLLAAPPARLAGLIEVRGLGILPVPHIAPVPVQLLVDLVPRHEIERLPDPWPRDTIAGLDLPVLRLSAFDASAPQKLALAMLNAPWTSTTASP